MAIAAANYLATRLTDHYPVLYTGAHGRVAHECIVDLRPITRASGVTVDDVAKRLIDYGFHAPTMSFPVAGTLMIEPTESEDLRELDRFCDAMIAIRAEIRRVEAGEWSIEESPLRNAPHTAEDVTGDWDRPVRTPARHLPGGRVARQQVLPARVADRLGVRRPQPRVLVRTARGIRPVGSRAVGENDQQRHDPLGDVINLFAAPIAGGIRSIEQFRHGIDELFRTIDNLNNTLETINEAAARVNRFMSDVEEPVRAILPQLTRTVQAADELMEVVSGPARRITPNLVQIVDTLGSPAFTTLPTQLGEFMRVMGDVSRRLGPLAQFAESAGGMFGFRIPGSSRSPQPTHAPAPLPLASAPELSAAISTSRSADAEEDDSPEDDSAEDEPRRRRQEDDGARRRPRARHRPRRSGRRRSAESASDEGRRDDLTGHPVAAHVDRHLVTDRHVGRHEPERDAVLEHRRVVPRCHLTDGRAIDEDRVAGPRGATARRRDADEAAVDAALAFRDERVASGEIALVPRDHPAQPGLQRRDAGTELVTVQRQRGFEPQRVASTEPGGHGAGGDESVPERSGDIGRNRDLDAILAGVAGAGDDARGRRATCTGATRNRPTCGRLRPERSRRVVRAVGPWTAITARSCVVSRPPITARTRSVLEAFGITSNTAVSPPLDGCHHTMMSSSTDASASSRRWVYWARPGPIFDRSFVKARWSTS